MAGLTEMPKVGDKVRYIGKYRSFIKVGKEYDVFGINEYYFDIRDDDGDMIGYDRSDFHKFEIVSKESESQPDVAGLLANLARRVSELETENKQQAYEINELYKAVAERG